MFLHYQDCIPNTQDAHPRHRNMGSHLMHQHRHLWLCQNINGTNNRWLTNSIFYRAADRMRDRYYITGFKVHTCSGKLREALICSYYLSKCIVLVWVTVRLLYCGDMSRFHDWGAQSIGSSEESDECLVVNKRVLMREREPTWADASISEDFTVSMKPIQGFPEFGERVISYDIMAH